MGLISRVSSRTYRFLDTNMSKCAHNLFCFVGLVLSIYTTYVEYKVHENPDYKAACDIDAIQASCTKAFSSDYGRGVFGMASDISDSTVTFENVAEKTIVDQIKFLIANTPNSILGIFYYVFVYWLGRHWDCPKAAGAGLFFSVISLFPTFWLAYVLMFILNDVCVVCITTYCCNFGLIFTNYRRRKALMVKSKKD